MNESATSRFAFHLSLNVADLDASVAFYSVMFGLEPVKRRDDYAKFELADPPLVLSLERSGATAPGRLNHVGFRATTSQDLVDVQRRLEFAGHSTIRQDGVECCYAKQTKFWVRDPDQTLWEWYVFEGDIEQRGTGRLPGAETEAKSPCCSPTPPSPRQRIVRRIGRRTGPKES